MALKWFWRNGRFGEKTGTARIGNMILEVSDSYGENQSYSITLEEKVGNTKAVRRTSILHCDTFYGGSKHARERVEFIGRSLYYGIPVELSDWEKKQKVSLNVCYGVRQPDPSSTIRNIAVRGIYHIPGQPVYFRAEYIANLEKVAGLISQPPTVVMKDVFTDSIYTFPLSEFASLGFRKFHEYPETHDVPAVLA